MTREGIFEFGVEKDGANSHGGIRAPSQFLNQRGRMRRKRAKKSVSLPPGRMEAIGIPCLTNDRVVLDDLVPR